jgi:hypothetical protein
LLEKPWQDAREGVKVKLLAEDGELYVFAQSHDRVTKERAMRRRQLKWLWKRLRQIAAMEVTREELLMKLGGARSKAPAAWRLVDVEIDKQRPSFTFALNRKKLRTTRRREGRYLLRTNLSDNDPAELWAILHPARRRRKGLPQSQRRFGDSSGLPSGREADRSPYLHRLSGLLPR